jgi:hypothetical protein
MNLTKTKEILDQLVRIHNEKNLLDEEAKDIKEVVESELPDVKFADLNKIAALKAKQKLGETISKLNEFTDLADALHN